MNVLALNCGSSSLKYRLVEMPRERELAAGEAQRIGPKTAEPSRILHKSGKEEKAHVLPMASHAEAFEEIMKLLDAEGWSPEAIGHRVVHGGELFSEPTIINDDVVQHLFEIQELAPLHNPPATALIKACLERYPGLAQAAVFDTSFHSTIPEYARTYALPEKLRRQMGIRKYGFHGISHQYVAEEAARWMGKDIDLFTGVCCHLGSGGASLCAIVRGKSVDNTMGYCPLQGLVMSTRCGDLDPAVALRLMIETCGAPDKVEEMLNKSSGILGLSGISGDIRDVLSAAADGGEQALRMAHTLQVYLWRIRKYLGAYLSVVGQANAVIFTDTIGESVPEVRSAVCSDMEVFDIKMEEEKNNNVTSLPADISKISSRTRILVMRTNEELAIARKTYGALSRPGSETPSIQTRRKL
jgi:acetate kinase